MNITAIIITAIICITVVAIYIIGGKGGKDNGHS